MTSWQNFLFPLLPLLSSSAIDAEVSEDANSSTSDAAAAAAMVVCAGVVSDVRLIAQSRSWVGVVTKLLSLRRCVAFIAGGGAISS